MRNAIRLLFAGLLCTAFTFPAAFAATSTKGTKKDDSPRAFLEAIYKRYTMPESKGVQLGSRPLLDRYFTASVAAQIDRDFATAKRKNEPPELNSDPFVGAQDWEIKNVRVAISNETSASASGLVTFNNAGRDQSIRYDLVRTTYGWRIDDIKWRDGSLRGIYRK